MNTPNHKGLTQPSGGVRGASEAEGLRASGWGELNALGHCCPCGV